MKGAVKDCVKVFLAGLLCGVAFGAVVFLIGLLAGGSVAGGVQAVKSGLLILLALGLLIAAGMVLMSGKHTGRFTGKDSWRKHFQVIGYRSAVMVFCAALLLASAADWLVRMV